jgi:hypothetical protein
MRRLPGPADCRLSEGDHPPEALYELFRDWQRTQTQSSVTALQGPRQQMDVWFCQAQEPMPGGTLCVWNILEVMTCTLSRACPGHPCLRLTDDLHGCRLYGMYGPPLYCKRKVKMTVWSAQMYPAFVRAIALGTRWNALRPRPI